MSERESKSSSLSDKVGSILFAPLHVHVPHFTWFRTNTDSLAYLTAATHGLTEEAEAIAETLSAHLDKVIW